jgi:hypothetical protein
MRLITRSDIKGPAIYAGMRDDYRKRIIELKRDRRVIVGDRVSMVFENRNTLISQIEEMLRAENLTTDKQIDEEIEVYNAIMPSADSLSATLFLEVPAGTDPRTELDRLIGLDEHLVLHVGTHPIRAAFEEGRGTTERISAVQYCRFPLTPEALADLRKEGTKLRMEIDHPGYQHVTECSEAMRASLAADYEGADS